MGVTVRTDEIETAIVEGLSEGVPLRQLCRLHGVSKSTVYNWVEADAELAGRVACARARGFEALAEEALEIADDGRNDWAVREAGDDGDKEADRLNHEHVSRSKLRIETRLKLLACWDPKRYGAKVGLTGPDGEGPVEIQTIRREVVKASA